MAKIHIGSEYCKTFDSIAKLYKEGCVEEGVIIRIDGDKIVTPSHEFVLSRKRTIKNDAEKAAVINDSGASWFGAFRGEKFKNNTAEWLMFVETIKEHFRRNYSVLEYYPRTEAISQEYIDRQIKKINNVLNCFYKDYVFEVRRGSEKEGTDDVYGASFRMEITDGTGEAVPVLGKIYFRKVKGGFAPYRSDEAELIDSQITSDFDEGAKREGTTQNSAALTDIVVNALDNLVNGSDSDISANLVFTDPTDKLAVERMVDKGPNEKVDLTCQSMSLINISHFKWRNDNYDILLGGKVVLKALMGIGDRLTLSCNSCAAKSVLVDSNRIKLRLDGQMKSVNINADMSDLNLTENAIEIINESGLFSDHIKLISCNENARLAGVCRRYVCAEEMIKIESGQGKNKRYIYKCKHCPHPEVIFKCDDGVIRYTKDLVFVRDAMTLRPANESVTCSCCGRVYTKINSKKSYLCDFCKVTDSGLDSLDEAEYKQGNRLYRKYSGMLPLAGRILRSKDKKYCKEDEDCIMFIVGSEVYIFNKDEASDSGFLKNPQRKIGGAQ